MKVNNSLTCLLIILCLYAIISCKERKDISDSRGLYQFDLSGRFVRQIGGTGRGPGEHGARIRFSVDTMQKEIMIFSSSIRNVYDLETGTYVRNFHLNMDVSNFAVFPQRNLILFTSELPPEAAVSSVNEVYLVDTNGKIVDSVPNYNRLNLERKSAGYAIYNSIYNDRHRYMYNFGDTLYTINSNFERAPYVVFNFDNEITSNQLVIEPVYDRIQHPDFILISRILENSEYLFLTIQKGIALMVDRDIQNFVYDKSTGDLVPTSGFINDIDGGLTFWP